MNSFLKKGTDEGKLGTTIEWPSCELTQAEYDVTHRSRLYHLRSIFRKKRKDFRLHFRLSGLIGLRSRRCPGSHRNPDCEKEFFLPGWRADAKQPCRMLGCVGKGMGRIGRDVDGLTRSHD